MENDMLADSKFPCMRTGTLESNVLREWHAKLSAEMEGVEDLD